MIHWMNPYNETNKCSSYRTPEAASYRLEPENPVFLQAHPSSPATVHSQGSILRQKYVGLVK